MTEYFWFVILAAVVVFLTFLIVPILFSIKDLKRTPLLHFEDNGNLVLEDSEADKEFKNPNNMKKYILDKSKALNKIFDDEDATFMSRKVYV